jgi:spermidine synthase
MAVNETGRRVQGARTVGGDPVLAFCFWLSGFAALVYQTAWTRQFALVFGTSELAVATVLAAYMGGLALGAWLVERWLPRISRPVLVYAGLELGIGAGAMLLVPALLAASEWLLRALFGGQPGPPDSSDASISVFYLISAFVVLCVPTVLMGATLPLLARHAVRDESHISRRVGFLYAVNTAGAVAGALATAFWLLPALGLTWSVRVAALVNVLIFGIAALLARGREVSHFGAEAAGVPPIGTGVEAVEPRDGAGALAAEARDLVPAHTVLILPLMLASGAVTFFHEVLWTRMLSHVLGSSIHAFGVMVASFLAGIALGGAVGARAARTRKLAHRAFAIAQLGCALAAIAGFTLMERLMPAGHGLVATAAFGATILLPLTFFIGTTFPLAVRILAADADDAASASARVYAWNTVGAIVGALSAGFVLIPWLRFEGSIQLAVIASCVIAIAHTWRVAVPTPRMFGGAVLASALAVCLFFRPAIPENLLHRSPLDIDTDGRVAYYGVGRSASVVMLEQDGGLVLRTNGLPEAMMETHGMVPRLTGESWLAPLAVIARPDVGSMLVVGYGGGVVVEAVPPSVRRIDVIELEPKVVEADRATASLRKHAPLLDPRLTLISNDARGALNLTQRKYDAIVSQPSHPWTAGASHLYTLEFMQQVREHLSDDGVFVQWMNAGFLDEPLLRSLTATLVTAFGEVRLYRPDPDTLVFLASAKPLDLETGLVASGRPLSSSPDHYRRHGIHNAEDLLATLAIDADGARALAAGAKPITDDHNRMATASFHDWGQGLDRQSLSRVLAAYDPLRNRDGWVFRTLGDRISFPYLERRMALYSSVDSTIPERIAAMNLALERSTGGSIMNAVLVDSSQKGSAADLVTRASDLARASEWKALSELDANLSEIAWTDPAKYQAIQLRAEWRSHVITPSLRRQLGDECVSILDEAIVAQPTLALYGLRARCGLVAARNDVVTESLWSLGNGTYHYALRLPPERREKARRDLRRIILALEKNLPIAPSGAFDSARRDEVALKLRAHISRLN